MARPKPLLIYYGWPSVINHAKTVRRAARYYSHYRYVVFGNGLESTDHPDHIDTQDIIERLRGTTKFFGYVDIGITTNGFSMSQIKNQLQNWSTMGVAGVLFDDFGFDYGVTRARQNEAVDLAHSYGLFVIANAWNPADAFEGRPALDYRDYYLCESFFVANGKIDHGWEERANQVAVYQKRINFKTLSITTNNEADIYRQDLFWAAWAAARNYEHTATGWGEYLYSADDSMAPWRPRPKVWQA